VALSFALCLAAPGEGRADDDASTGALVATGLALAVPSYWLGLTVHEGSHALAAKAFGAEVTELRLWPGRHPRTNTFFFGWVSYRGNLSKGEKTVFFLAPKIADLVLLSTFVTLQATGTLPDNDYAALTIAVFATGSWVDFSKDIIAFRPANDVMRVHAMYGNDTELDRLPWRLLHAGVSAAAGYFIVREYADIFDSSDAEQTAGVSLPRTFMLPLWDARF